MKNGPRPLLERLALVLEGLETVEALADLGADEAALRGGMAFLAELADIKVEMGL